MHGFESVKAQTDRTRFGNATRIFIDIYLYYFSMFFKYS
jgi:hypothetical protein